MILGCEMRRCDERIVRERFEGTDEELLGRCQSVTVETRKPE